MDLNLTLSAQTLRLASDLQTSGPMDGILVVKNDFAKTYLRVTPRQWELLQEFKEPQIVPAVLERAISEQTCPPVGEFFELILKALRANVLLEPAVEPTPVPVTPWWFPISPAPALYPILISIVLGLLLPLAFRPALPLTVSEGIASLFGLLVGLTAGSLLAGSLLRGSGGEVYRLKWTWLPIPHLRIDAADAVILARRPQIVVALAPAATLALIVGLTVWHRPAWSFLPLLGLLTLLRPFGGGSFSSLLQFIRKRPLSDADHSPLFSPNRVSGRRWTYLVRALSEPANWIRLGHAIVWTLLVVYLPGWIGETPPWTSTFWIETGPYLGLSVIISSTMVMLIYFGVGILRFIRTHAWSFHRGYRLWRARWSCPRLPELDDVARFAVVAKSPVLSLLSLLLRKQLARSMQDARVGSRQRMPEFEGATPTHVALIVSGKISLGVEPTPGRQKFERVLVEGDLIGLHDLADPAHPVYTVRTLTPALLLVVDRATADELIVKHVGPAALISRLLKLPFLRETSLCADWHIQAIIRFAELCTLLDCPSGEDIITEGQDNQTLCLVFEGEAAVCKNSEPVSALQVGEYFGEIGLLQNSRSEFAVTARQGTRCLTIPRHDFMRFVTHNHAVALHLEKVSSARIGRPIFPVIPSSVSPELIPVELAEV